METKKESKEVKAEAKTPQTPPSNATVEEMRGGRRLQFFRGFLYCGRRPILSTVSLILLKSDDSKFCSFFMKPLAFLGE